MMAAVINEGRGRQRTTVDHSGPDAEQRRGRGDSIGGLFSATPTPRPVTYKVRTSPADVYL